MTDPNQDRDDNNANEMTGDEWSEFYDDRDAMGMDFEDYLDNDMSMNG